MKRRRRAGPGDPPQTPRRAEGLRKLQGYTSPQVPARPLPRAQDPRGGGGGTSTLGWQPNVGYFVEITHKTRFSATRMGGPS